mmetsp:Transcript_8519/g.18563  ORF Transcript_8519/g.18563 Transcript_8519/m.18563 type:complete len:210 (+) Transcript_8519:1655-2284(+)
MGSEHRKDSLASTTRTRVRRFSWLPGFWKTRRKHSPRLRLTPHSLSIAPFNASSRCLRRRNVDGVLEDELQALEASWAAAEEALAALRRSSAAMASPRPPSGASEASPVRASNCLSASEAQKRSSPLLRVVCEGEELPWSMKSSSALLASASMAWSSADSADSPMACLLPPSAWMARPSSESRVACLWTTCLEPGFFSSSLESIAAHLS